MNGLELISLLTVAPLLLLALTLLLVLLTLPRLRDDISPQTDRQQTDRLRLPLRRRQR